MGSKDHLKVNLKVHYITNGWKQVLNIPNLGKRVCHKKSDQHFEIWFRLIRAGIVIWKFR